MKKYTILKNWHYAFLFFGRFLGWHYNKKNYSLNFKFSKECWWKIPRNIDDYDINKLCGLSFGFPYTKNSVRLGWTPNFDNDGSIFLYAYIHDNYKFIYKKFISEFFVEIEYLCQLYLDENKYVLTINNETIEIEHEKLNKIQKEEYPYFGGDNKAINKMIIYTEVKKL